MKNFKIIDTWGSIILITGAVLYALIQRDETAFLGYFIVGGWQVMSIVVHTVRGWFINAQNRKSYHILVALIALVGLIGWIANPVLWVLMFVLFFASPFMAIYYACICYQEVYVKMQRPLAVLK